MPAVLPAPIRAAVRRLFPVLLSAQLITACGSSVMQAPPVANQASIAQIPAGHVDTAKYKHNGPYTVCFSNASASNSWRQTMVEHVRFEVKRHPEIKTFRETDANDDPAKQISDTEGMLAQGCDLLLISPAKQDELKPVVDKAMQMGVPVVAVDRKVAGDNFISFVSSNNCDMGRVQAEWLVKDLNGQGDIVLLSGVKGSSVAEDRMRCAREVFAQHPGIKERAQAYANWSPVDGKKIMAEWITTIDKIDGVWSDGSQGVGAVQAYLEAGKKVPAITGNGINSFMKQWKEHNFPAVAVVYPARMGQLAVLTGLDILSGKPVPSVVSVPQQVITKDNLDQFVRTDLPDGYWPDSDPEVVKLMFPQ